MSGAGFGIHWPDIDEDLSTEGLLRGVPADSGTRSHEIRTLMFESLLQPDRLARSRRLPRGVENLRHDHVVLERRKTRGLDPSAHHRGQIGNGIALIRSTRRRCLRLFLLIAPAARADRCL